ncbi:MAG: hypothetical protein ABJB86_06040, partial [Bacteroidota bacterium]
MVVAASLLLIFLLYKEWKRNNRLHLYGRLIASSLAVVSLLFMGYPYNERSHSTAKKNIIILTGGFAKDSVEQFLHQAKKEIPIFSAAAVQSKTSLNDSVQLIADWHTFSQKHTGDVVHVFGNGLNNEVLAELDPHSIVFHASAAAPGISHVYWKQYLQPGEPLIVQGHYENSSAQKIKILLQAFGAIKDSLFINAFSSQDFVLRTIPLQFGKAVYSLITVAGKDTLGKEPVPAGVETATALQLLIISSSPDFENTFLKNHLSHQGYQVTMFTTVSSNKINKQFINSLQQPSGKLTRSYLNKFDVLMADEEALENMSSNELTAMRSAIQDNGTGLVIKIDTQKNINAFYSKPFHLKKIQRGKQPVSLLYSTGADSNQYTIKILDPLRIEYVPGTQVILQDAQSNMYAACIAYGSGKIIATTLQNTYSMALAGDSASYQQLWSAVLNKAAKKIYPEESWQTNSFIPHINKPVQLLTEDNNAGFPKAILPGANIYLTQDEMLPFQWRGKYWPAAYGWQPLPKLKTGERSWYVYKTNDWQSIANYENLTGTKKYAAMHPLSVSEPGINAFFVNWPLFMLIIFLSSCIFLWVEQKAA